MKFKKSKIFGKDEDGFYLGKIEDIHDNKIYISNREKDTFFNFRYRLLGIFKVDISRLNQFKINYLVIVEKRNGKIVNIIKDDRLLTY